MHKLKCTACAVLDNQDRETKVGLITNAIDRLNKGLVFNVYYLCKIVPPTCVTSF